MQEMRTKLLEELLAFQPQNEQEQIDKKRIGELVKSEPKAATREVPLHLTASCWITNYELDQVLFCHHIIYNAWAWLGGHADGNFCLREVALKEAYEESGLMCTLAKDPLISLEILPVAKHMRRAVEVAAHHHANLTYHLLADEDSLLRIADAENTALRWFSLDTIPHDEPHMIEIYNKLVKRTLQRKNFLGL